MTKLKPPSGQSGVKKLFFDENYFSEVIMIFGAASSVSLLAVLANFSKFFTNCLASSFAFSSYAFLSDQVLRGFNTSSGTFRQVFGTATPNPGCVSQSTLFRSPFNASLIIARV